MSAENFLVASPVSGAAPEGAVTAEMPNTAPNPIPTAEAPEGQPAPQAPAAPKSLELGKKDRPAWLPEEYATPEDFRKAHDSLRAKMAGKADDKVLITEGDLQTYMQEVVGAGTLSEGSRKALRAKGFSDGLIDQHVAGLQAIRDGQLQKTFQLAGGQERYGQIATWAAENLSASEQSAYNAAVNSGNAQIVEMAVQGLKARFELAGGGQADPAQRPAPTRLAGGAPSGALGVKMFASMAEQVKAQADPRYAADPNYRAAVEKMIDASIKSGRY